MGRLKAAEEKGVEGWGKRLAMETSREAGKEGKALQCRG